MSTPGLSAVVPGLGPDGFVIGGLGWSPWIEPLPKEELTPEHISALIEPERADSPYFRLLVRDPEALRARTLTDLDIFYNEDSGLPRAARELSAAAVSRFNGCVFCASVHTNFALKLEPDRRAEIEALLAGGSKSDLGDDTWNAVAAAAVALTATPSQFGQENIDQLHAVGLDDVAIIDVIFSAAFFNWANRLMLSLGEPEDASKRRQAKAQS